MTQKQLPQALQSAIGFANSVELHIAQASLALLQSRPQLQTELAALDNQMQDGSNFEAFAAIDVACFDLMSAFQAASERLIEASAHLKRIETIAQSAATFCPQPDSGE